MFRCLASCRTFGFLRSFLVKGFIPNFANAFAIFSGVKLVAIGELGEGKPLSALYGRVAK